MISERFNTKFRLFSGSSGSGSSTGPSGTTTTPSTETPKNPADQQRVQELTQEYQKQLADGTMSQGTANGLVKKLEGTAKDSNGNYTTDGLKYLALKQLVGDDTSSSPKTVSSSSNNHANKDTIVSNDRSNYNPTPTTTTAPEQNSNQAYVDSGNNGGSNQKSIGDYTDEELEQAIKALEKGSGTALGKTFNTLYENAIKKYKDELARRHPAETTSTEPTATTASEEWKPSTYGEITSDYVDKLKGQYAGKSSDELLKAINEGNNNASSLSHAEQVQWEATRQALNRAYEDALKAEKEQQIQQLTQPITQIQPVTQQVVPETTTQQQTVPEDTTQTTTPTETEQKTEQETTKESYVPHETTYTANAELGNRFNGGSEVINNMNKAFDNLYMIGSGNYYKPDGSANQNLYGMNNA